jgi:signal transduction histidine kinase
MLTRQDVAAIHLMFCVCLAGAKSLSLEESRLASLFRYNVLDTPPEAGFDDIVRIAAWVCETPVSLVSFVSYDRQWFKARTGFDACETTLDRSVCAHVVKQGELLVIPDLTADARTRDNPLVTGPPYIRFYAGAPLMTPEHEVLGALCVIDNRPRPVGLSEGQRDAIIVLAGQVMMQLELRRISETRQRDLLAALGATELREQFIAVLGHDLRNPLTAISTGVQMLQGRPSAATSERVVAMMQRSVMRMSGLIDNVLDFASGSLGGAFNIDRRPGQLRPVLEHVVAELQTSWPGKTIQTTFALDQPVDCDPARIAQLFSNLLGNALVHGLPASTITVRAAIRDGVFELEVANPSPQIPPETLERLFQPFVRGESAPAGRGLGLGLYIASQIAAAHHGELTARWSEGWTRFLLVMPSASALLEDAHVTN